MHSNSVAPRVAASVASGAATVAQRAESFSLGDDRSFDVGFERSRDPKCEPLIALGRHGIDGEGSYRRRSAIVPWRNERHAKPRFHRQVEDLDVIGGLAERPPQEEEAGRLEQTPNAEKPRAVVPRGFPVSTETNATRT